MCFLFLVSLLLFCLSSFVSSSLEENSVLFGFNLELALNKRW